ncbi:MAG TPA: CapA family protein [Allosphingosinicella sp.]|nr:CapA family protein [Allosphingosinicella sp.]
MRFKSLAFVSLSVGVATAALAIGTGRLSPAADAGAVTVPVGAGPAPESAAPAAPGAPPREEIYTGAAAGLAQANPAPGAPGRRRARASYRVIGVGDIMMGSDWPTPIMDERITPSADPADLLGREMAGLFRGGDVVFGNVEGTIHTRSDNAKACGNPAVCFTFRSPPFHAAYLRRAGFTLVSNANNHSRDFGEPGRAETYRNLTGAGLAVSGADTPTTRIGVQTLADGTRFALVAFGHNPGLMQVTDLARLGAMVREAGRQADVVIVSCHIGAEGEGRSAITRANELFLGENRGNPYAFAHAAVDAGADIVFCHGPHVPRAIEVYRGRFIAYSLGNFWTYGRFSLRGSSTLAPIAALEVARDGRLLSARIVSARQERPGGPVYDPAGGAARQIAALTAQDFPDSGLRIAGDGTVRWARGD